VRPTLGCRCGRDIRLLYVGDRCCDRQRPFLNVPARLASAAGVAARHGERCAPLAG
jgi:hypothetical protein